MRISSPDRYQRVRDAISDYDRLRQSTVLLLGIGALGNEVAKNLVLLGVGRLIVVDFDRIEESNLSRSLLFRQSDADRRRPKCEVAARRLRALNPDVDVRSFFLDCTWELGDGVFRNADAIIGAVDGWFPRWLINRSVLRVSQTWTVAGINHRGGWVWGVASEFGGCMECFMPADKRHQFRITCAHAMQGIIEEGGVPTTPMTAAIAASFQTDAALRYIGCDIKGPSWRGQGIAFDTVAQTLHKLDLERNAECAAHSAFTRVVTAPLRAKRATVQELFSWLRSQFAFDPVVDVSIAGIYSRVIYLACSRCHYREMWGKPSFFSPGAVPCPHCNTVLNPIHMTEWCDRAPHDRELEPIWKMPLAECGIPSMHILPVSNLADRRMVVGVELSGDYAQWFGAK